MTKLTISRLYKSCTDKSGKEFKSKFGKPYQKIAIKALETGDKWISGFIFDTNDPRNQWKEGDEVEWEIKENGEFLNFENWEKPGKKRMVSLEKFNELAKRIEKLELKVAEIENIIKS